VRPYAAEYLGQFVAGSSGGGFTSGSQWLVWKFESDATLGDAIGGDLGPFPVRAGPTFAPAISRPLPGVCVPVLPRPLPGSVLLSRFQSLSVGGIPF
jgi:hypothetical protein